VLHRLIYISDAVGSTGTSVLSIAQILGLAERNNRRDHITSGVMFHDGRCLQAIEGSRVDIDRLMNRLREDRRHTNLRVLVDKPIAERRFCEPMGLCRDPASLLRLIGSPDMASLTAYEAERIVDVKQAA
jgi:hypothetical protein